MVIATAAWERCREECSSLRTRGLPGALCRYLWWEMQSPAGVTDRARHQLVQLTPSVCGESLWGWTRGLHGSVLISLGDIEKKYHLGVSPLCDRQTETIANIQIGNCSSLWFWRLEKAHGRSVSRRWYPPGAGAATGLSVVVVNKVVM